MEKINMKRKPFHASYLNSVRYHFRYYQIGTTLKDCFFTVQHIITAKHIAVEMPETMRRMLSFAEIKGANVLRGKLKDLFEYQ